MLHRRVVGLTTLVLFAGALVAVACVGSDPEVVDSADSGGGVDGTGGDSNTSGSSSGADATPSCVSPQVPCGTGCVDPSTYANDSANCGACGRSCGAGSTCTANVCSVVTILPQSDAGSGKEIVSIAVDATSVYFNAGVGVVGTTHGSIAKCPLSSCTSPIALYNAQYVDVERLLTVPSAAGFVYYTDNANDHAFRILADGGAEAGTFPGTSTPCASNPPHCAVDLATNGGHPYPLASDGKYLYTFRYYMGSGKGGVRVLLPSGTTGNEFGSGDAGIDVAGLGLALDPTDPNHRWLYVAGETGVYAVETDNGYTNPVLLSNGAGGAATGGIGVGKGTVVFTHAGGVASLATCPAQAGVGCAAGITGVFAVTAGAEAMTSDATNVYWSGTGHIYMCPFTGCPGDKAVVVADTTARVRTMTSDDKTLYWGDDKGGLYRLAK